MHFRLADKEGSPAPVEDVVTAVRVLEKRFGAAELAGIEVAPTGDGQITVRIPKALESKAETVWQLAEQGGSLEFRIVADPAKTKEARAVRDIGGADVPPPLGYAWAPSRNSGPDLLVCVPEESSLEKLRALDRKGVAHEAPEYADARKEYDETARAEVFGGVDIDRAEIHRQTTQTVIYFALRADRKREFTSFTERHVRDSIAIILDGKVQSAPVIKSALPGEGIIEGGGASGFTDAEARSLAVVLGAGSMPGRLSRVEAPEKK